MLDSDTVRREDIGDGFWLVVDRSLRRQTGMIGLELAASHRFGDADEFREMIRAKMGIMECRLLEAYRLAEAEEEEPA